jgi:Uma2 family endonuclease
MSEAARQSSMTVREFLRWEDGTDTHYELVRGQPVAMAPPSGRHAVLTRNAQDTLSAKLRPPCASFFGAGVARSEDDDECRLPDVFVTCEPTPERVFTAPRLIVEVLSPSTMKDDRTDKLDFYKSLASVDTVLLVWQDKRRVQLNARVDDGWLTQDLVGGGRIELPALGIVLTLNDLYEGVELPEIG